MQSRDRKSVSPYTSFMFDRITQLILACACLAITFGVMNITVAAQNAQYQISDEAKCEIATAWIERWSNSESSPRYYDVEIGSVPHRFFPVRCNGLTCEPDLTKKRFAMPSHKCGLESIGVIDTHRRHGYTNRNEMFANEKLLSLGVHFVDIAGDGQSANLFVSRYVVPSEDPYLYCGTGAYFSISAKMSESGWTFYE